MNYDVANRDASLPKLIEYVRLPLLPRDYLIERVETEPLIKRSFACKDFLIEALKYHLVPRFQRSYIQSPRTRSRAPVGFPKVLYVVGGQAPKAIRRYVVNFMFYCLLVFFVWNEIEMKRFEVTTGAVASIYMHCYK